MRLRAFLPAFFSITLTNFAAAQTQAPALPQPDARYKADVLLVVAHPDDDVVVGGYLARLSLDEHKHIAVVYITNGDGGGNAVGNESGLALGQERQIEARTALHSIGVEDVWFLDGSDTPGQNPLRSLDRWNHGKMLDELVRLVRITRPEVILTWLPEQVVGENHGDHQAAGVLAVEAFDQSGEPLAFPEQVSPPRDHGGLMNLAEGLHPWQSKKLYFFTDAFEVFTPYWHDAAEVPNFRKNIGDGFGPVYDTKTISSARHVSYAQLAAEQQTFYATQDGVIGVNALKKHDLTRFEYPVRLIFGKSLVGGSVTDDVFENITREPARPAVLHHDHDVDQTGLSLEMGDPWRFYGQWWRAHGLEHLALMIPEPEVAAAPREQINIPLLACNHSASDTEIDITASAPEGWGGGLQYSRYLVRAGECYPMVAYLIAPSTEKPSWQELNWSASIGSKQIGRVLVRAYVGQSGGLPQ